jgi:hypothetical protein
LKKIKDAGPLRTITIGVNKAAEEPSDDDFDNAAVYRIDIAGDFTQQEQQLLRIDYRGDVARLYADGKLIDDNFYNGRPFVYGLWRLPADCSSLELRILPIQKDMPIYFPREANVEVGEEVLSVKVVGITQAY